MASSRLGSGPDSLSAKLGGCDHVQLVPLLTVACASVPCCLSLLPSIALPSSCPPVAPEALQAAR